MKFFMLFALVLGTSAHASVLFEPYGGYSMGTLSDTPTGGTQTTSAINGFDYGGRAGFMFDHFLIVAYEYQGLSATIKQSGATTSNSFNQETQYITAGFQAPFVGVRLLGSYGFQSKATDQTVPSTVVTGTSYKLTLGWQFASHVAINAEYAIYNMTNTTSNGTTSKISDSFSKFSDSAAMINISFPFTFFHWGSSGSSGKSRAP